MADSILRLKVESQEYDQKIKRAAEGIQQYAQKCRDAGGTLQYLDDGVLEFVKSLGKMDTVATGTKQQLREMSNALTTLTKTYRGLTDEEKASPFGQELAKGIQQLTERAGQAKDAMMDVEQSIKNAASDTRMFDQMAQGMSVATAGFQGLTGAGKLLGIEMGNDVEVIAKLQAAMAVTNSLTTIQTALQKQSALMQGLNAAKTALATAAQHANAIAIGEATVAQTAFNVVASANPYGLLLASAGALVGVVTAFASTTGEATSALESEKDVIDELAKSVDKAAESYKNLASQMKSLGIGGQKEYNILIQAKANQFQDVRNAWLNVGYEKRKEEERNGKDTEKWKALDEEQKRLHDEMLKVQKEYNELRRINKDRVKRLNQYARLDFSDITTESEARSALSFLQEQKKYKDPTSRDYGNIKRAIEYVENILLPQFQDKTEVKAKSQATHIQKETVILKKSIGDYENQIKELRATEKDVTTTEEWEALQHKIGELTIKVKELKGELKTVPASISDATNKATDAQNKKIEDRLNDPSVVSKGMANIVKQIGKEQGKEEKKYLVDGFGKLAGGLGGIQSGFQQIGIDLGDGFSAVVGGLQGITTILTAIQTIVGAIELISSADAIIPFARGGVAHAAVGFMVPGNNFSGDLVPAYLNSGEMVLNRFQQQALAGTLENGGMKNISISGHLDGETIALSVDRWGKRSGRGELAFWKNQ
jgi:hypothetical protein